MNRHEKLLEIAKSQIGIKEEGADNQGKDIKKFQEAIDGKAQGESWCCGFAFWCIKQTDLWFDEQAKMSLSERHTLFETEHCMTLYQKCKITNLVKEPFPGCLIIWQFYKDGKQTPSGHIGIVTNVDGDKVHTIEGNTSDAESVERNGGGVYAKKRSKVMNTGPMRVIAYLDPWKKN